MTRGFGMLRFASLCLVTLVAGLATPAMAQVVDCNTVQRLVPPDRLVESINDSVSGAEYRINRRKRLRINHVERLQLSGCSADLRANVTLHRRIRRDAHGTIDIRGRASFVVHGVYMRHGNQRVRGEVCLHDPRVTRVSLSRTLGIGERVYQWVANLIIPNQHCEEIDVAVPFQLRL